MLFTVSTTHRPARDLGFLLHKHPDRVHSRELAFGKATVFYPEASDDRCTAALLLEVDPVALVRGRPDSAASGPLAQYVNDRPYALSSFLSVAISRLLGTALGGRCEARPELAAAALPLEAVLAPLPCRGGEPLLRRLFEPLGYTLEAEGGPLDPAFPDWGESPYLTVRLRRTGTLAELLNHIYVLVPVLDDRKHYWVGDDEVEKLLAHGEGWLAGHPERDLIVNRALKRRGNLARAALERLVAAEAPEAADPEAEQRRDASEQSLERPLRLNDRRHEAVAAALRDSGAQRVVDLGCGEGRLLARLLKDGQFSEIVGLDASARSLEIAAERLHLAEMAPRQRERIRLLHGALTYRDRRIEGFDAAALVEVIEHLDIDRLPALERVVFGEGQPATVVVTTPNADYNALFPGLAAGAFRHPDHRFEWTREEFRAWVKRVEDAWGYTAALSDIGAVHPELGAPTQMAVFSR